ncbi:MAG: class I SAM-dependent methyltransferase [Sinobacteraceae bacterium]|nr:class I SAM-dependent methyltransferase [Nevskiaceae bacterium]
MSASQPGTWQLDREIERRRRLEQRIYRDLVNPRPGTHWQTVKKMLVDPDYAQSVIRKNLYKHLDTVLPRRGPLPTTDRLVLELEVFQYYQSRADIEDVLFVGCDGDTAHYENSYFGNKRFVTLEPNPANRKFGASHHVEAVLQSLGEHFPPAAFDLIICNGVIGFGLDTPEACEAAFEQCHHCLREGGQLLVGWNDLPHRTPCPLEQIHSLSRFHKHRFPPLGAWRYRTDTAYRHVFDFYIK